MSECVGGWVSECGWAGGRASEQVSENLVMIGYWEDEACYATSE